MSTRTLLVLVLLVAGLGAVWLMRQRETLQGGPPLDEFPLVPSLAVERVRALRIDHLERGFQLKLERDAGGRWFMTDPIAYPARGALVRTILQGLADARGEPAPEADPQQVGLEPPGIVVECIQVEEDGEHTLRIELGALDLDPSRVYARVPGHPHGRSGGGEVFRTLRSISNTLERNPDDYRDPRVTEIAPQAVISLRRQGMVYLEEASGRTGIDFDALLGPDGWKRVGLPTVSLDPNGMGLLARGATALSIERYVDDSPDDLSTWGLDEPLFTIEIEALSHKPVRLAFGCSAPDGPISAATWYCQRIGYGHVWQVETRDVELLTRPAELFFDQLLVRVLRDEIQRIELEGGGARRVFARDKDGWNVWQVGQDGTETAPAPGENGAIQDVLGLLERSQLAEHLGREVFEPTQPPLSFRLTLRNDGLVGGALGRPTRDPRSGAEGRQFLRLGDEVAAVLGDEIAELCMRPLEEFRSRRFHRVRESQVRVIELEHAGTTYAYVNNGDNLWNPRGTTLKTPAAFLQALDGLLNLGVEQWLDQAPVEEPALTVHLSGPAGGPLHFSFVATAAGEVVCVALDGRVARVDGALLERLLKLF